MTVLSESNPLPYRQGASSGIATGSWTWCAPRKGRLLHESVKPLEVDIAAIHHVQRSGFQRQLAEDLDVAHLATREEDEGGSVAVQIQQRLHFDGGLVLAERRPRKQPHS